MNEDRNSHDYLWDPDAPPDPAVVALERRLAPLRFDPDAASLDLPVRTVRAPGRAWPRVLVPLALAASLIAAAGVGAWSWRLAWPEGRAWTMRTGAGDSPLEVGRAVTVPANGQAVANVARLGTMRLEGGSEIELRATRGRRHRLRMSEGLMHVRVWAPPVSVVIETPAGDVVDMGCEFVLSVDGASSAVRVLSGWVLLENSIAEVAVPAGASSEMTAAERPGVPVFDDAAEGFREAVRRVEREGAAAPLDELLRAARARDVYTLLLLADRQPAVAEPLLRRAADLSPPPDDVTIGRIVRGDARALWAWSDSLPLPPLKGSWWLNWRDALPLTLR